jgi:hypothetical protein
MFSMLPATGTATDVPAASGLFGYSTLRALTITYSIRYS